MPESERDYHNSDSVKMFRVIAAGPGRVTRKGVLIPNEIKAGDNVIVDARTGGRPQELGEGRFIISNPDDAVIAVCPLQVAGSQPAQA
jgi:co-chaperonin GroES (HSP10)